MLGKVFAGIAMAVYGIVHLYLFDMENGAGVLGLISLVAMGLTVLIYRGLLEFEPETAVSWSVAVFGLVWLVGSFVVIEGVTWSVNIIGWLSLAYLAAGLVMVIVEGIHAKVLKRRKRRVESEITNRVSA